ncbi:MAG: protease complex subunit PrcB family protein [Firmicutes bacterium]|nr:protease complex subunit PrcB family protein [Sporosalibacterium faouarense]MTI47346.1 protease complex subunit PrcB family protein [Bacillota bacterium]
MKRLWILGLVVIIVLGIIFIPKLIFNEGDNTVKFNVLEEKQIPQKIKEILPQYRVEERALACRIEDSVYVIVTRGEKRTGGYSVAIDRIEKEKSDDYFNLIVYAKYTDPSPDQIVPQVITYPYTIVKTDLKELPQNIRLEVEYDE